jgi:hypothetical protein
MLIRFVRMSIICFYTLEGGAKRSPRTSLGRGAVPRRLTLELQIPTQVTKDLKNPSW